MKLIHENIQFVLLGWDIDKVRILKKEINSTPIKQISTVLYEHMEDKDETRKSPFKIDITCSRSSKISALLADLNNAVDTALIQHPQATAKDKTLVPYFNTSSLMGHTSLFRANKNIRKIVDRYVVPMMRY